MPDRSPTLAAQARLSHDLLQAVRRDAPLVQCLTNFVSMNYAANALLAIGASPAMVHAAEEAPEFARLSGAVVINIGTLSAPWLDSMLLTAGSAGRAGTPWVLDPVAHHATAFRRDAVARLLDLRPAVIRGNASEIIALAGGQSAGKGVDARDAVAQAEESARALAAARQTVVAVTGETDYVTDGSRALRITGGSPWMPRVTATGCALTAVVGAFAAVSRDDPYAAAVAALSCFGIAGASAHDQAQGPGSYAWRFLDALAALDAASLVRASPLRA
ncbi:hydroxyethylthiazole kinase [Achromobacter pulmonis]|uniref:Hydroxyethylthiazole kinase n=1 Tax=Achromobacter pulmonis TaxID=1389932 RepID=A0A2N8KKJ6_9BURK|nr:hydroxyethylthiazole kinase [Achromobacter pulmonis]MBO9330585.1 hydroxyethylthiazole kinase [Achromobacter xylosoxidans]PND33976.1 hydroxyethylthiazole kinase [Achromobacter pulmonis]